MLQSKTFLQSSSFSAVLTALLASGMTLTSHSAKANSFSEALTKGSANVDMRLRYESVDQKGTDNASAFTVRTRVGYKTADYHGVKGFIEYTGTESLADRQDYRVPAGPDAGGGAGKAVIADPAITRLNQAWIGYDFSKSNAKLGQQRIVMDPRFLGNVGFRQTEQVYTGLRAMVKEFDAVKLDYAYITQNNTILGTEVPMQTHALKADLMVIPKAKLSGYAYLIDTDDSTADSQTLGARLAGKAKLSDSFGLMYHLEAADQSDYADAKDIGGSYYHVKVGANFSGVKVFVAQELLGGDGKSSFQTPLATKHAYNGFADKFLTTPVNGLSDTYIKVATKVSGVKLAAFYHDFKSDKGGINYGSEVDLVAAMKVAKIYTIGAKYANYSADQFATDTSKIWVWAGMAF